MHATEIVGWRYNGAAYCLRCFGNGRKFPPHVSASDEGWKAVFASDEGWESDSCGGCGMTLAERSEVEREDEEGVEA